MKAIKLKKEHAIAGSLLIAAVYIFLIFLPSFRLAKSLGANVKELRKNVQLTQRDLQDIDRFKREIQEFKAIIDEFEKRLPREKDMDALLKDLSNEAQASNVKITGLMPAEEIPGAGLYQEYQIKIYAKGGYHQLAGFINKLENARRFMSVQDVVIQNDEENRHKHNLQLLISTYVLTR